MKRSIPIILMASIMLVMVKASHSELNEGLVLYYPFNGNAQDESGNANNGVEYGVGYEAGVLDQSAKFDGKNDYIRIPKSTEIENLKVMTLTYWIKSDQTDIGIGTSVTTYGGDWPSPWEDGFFTYIHTDNGISHWLGTHNDAVIVKVPIKTNLTLTEQCFTFVVFIASIDKIKIYKNAKFIEETDRLNKNISRTGKDWYIGQTGWNQYYMKGNIDEVRLYNRVISETEINTLYNEAGSYCESQTIYVEPIIKNIPSISGTTNFTVTSDLSWTIESSELWYTILSDNNTITVNYNANTSDSRTASIIVSAENAINSPQIIKITQEAGNPTNNYTDTDMDGVIDFFDNCNDTPQNSYVDNKGCDFDFSSVYTQEELSSAISSAISEKINIIAEKESDIDELNDRIRSMFTQEQLNNKLQESEDLCNSIISQKDLNITELTEIMKNMYTKEQMSKMVGYILLWGDTNNDGKIGLPEAIQALMTSSGINR